MEKSLNLKSKSEMAGARKLLGILKRAGRIRGRVELQAANPTKRGPTRLHRTGPKNAAAQLARRRVTIARQLRKMGVDISRIPQLSKDDPFGDKRLRALRAARRKANPTARRKAAPKRKKRLSKKQEFLRRMRLGRLRAARARARKRR